MTGAYVALVLPRVAQTHDKRLESVRWARPKSDCEKLPAEGGRKVEDCGGGGGSCCGDDNDGDGVGVTPRRGLTQLVCIP
jgi:hypothetical protein